MLIQDSYNQTGRLHIVIFDANGIVRKDVHIPNVVTTVGKQTTQSILTGATPASDYVNDMQVGTGTAAAASSDTALGASIYTQSTSSITAVGAVITHIATFPVGSINAAVTEAGLFNGATMFARTVFPTLNITSADGVQITWQITQN
jgi:hypothetical protein